MITQQVTCDQCGKDITYTGNCEDWRIVLANEDIPHKGCTATAMSIRPCLERTYHFCGTSCLKDFVKEKL